MKDYKFTQEQKLLHHLILHSHDVPTAWGLFDGMTGIMLVIAHYARVHKRPAINHVSDYLMKQIIGNLTKTASISFGNGLAGVGWGLEYLIQNGYMKGCGAALTREIDDRIMSVDIRRLADDSMEKGIVGLFHYVIAHLQGATLQGLSVFDRQYLDDWAQLLRHQHECFPQNQRWGAMNEILAKTISGQRHYTLDLLPFIKPMKRASLDLLGLHNGLAGYIELQLHNYSNV